MSYPKSIIRLKENFKKLPGIGEKSAERLAFSIIDMNLEDIEDFSEALINVKTKIQLCKICNNISENDVCEICQDEKRDKNTICVVENAKSLILFENLSVYNGKYFVLDKLISPLDKIGPEDININKLICRINSENIKEVILAIKPTIEGETTSLYISKLLGKMNVEVTRIAHGIPLGVDMEYIDSLTLELAFQDRIKIS